ncbi:hypothetical protein ABKN59_010812 [Abortiporus biennis]
MFGKFLKTDSATHIRIYSDSPENLRDHLLMIFVPPGTVCWSDLSTKAKYIQYPTNDRLLRKMKKTMKTTEILILTDMVHLVFFDTIAVPKHTRGYVVYNQFCLREQLSIRFIIGAALYSLDGKPDYPKSFRSVLQGALNRHYEPIQSFSMQGWERRSPLPFRNFDYFTLQRSLPAFMDFLAWKKKESSRLCSNPVDVGSIFKVDFNSFSRNHPLFRSFFPHQPLPKETIDAATRSFRPRSKEIDEFLTMKGDIFFKVTKIIRQKPDTFSQAFLGVLRTENGIESPPLFLKLFVEGLFPVEEEHLLSEFNVESRSFEEDPSRRLRSLNFADDMLRREEFAYSRLSTFQGTLLPHYYGIHTFTLDGVLSSYGMMLEIIPGLPFSEVHFEEWKKTRQVSFIRQLRHCIRVLLYAGIEQQDVHEDQVLLPQGQNYSEAAGTIVFIDFAFAPPRLGDEQADKIIAPYVGNSWGKMRLMLNCEHDILEDEWKQSDLEEL